MDTTERAGSLTGSTYDGFISYSHAADGLLAPRLQAGLQRFAKPWWKRRAVRIFRDESSLSANPHLWSSITEALDTSGWFVLLLSPDAAESEWVNQEIAYWVENRDPSRILPVVTDGTFGWVNGLMVGSAVPDALQGVFTEEPRWVDLRFARGEEQLDLQNPRFSAAIADIASAIRGVPKDELESEEVRHHRRAIRTAWAAGVIVLLLGIGATVGAIVAVNESNEAQEQRDEAERQAEIAQTERDTAQQERDRADEQAGIARSNEQRALDAESDAREKAEVAQTERDRADAEARIARSEALAANAIAQLGLDPELSVLLAAEALQVEPRPAAVKAMHSALQEHRTIFQVAAPASDGPLAAVGGISPDGTLLAVGRGYTDLIDVWEIDSGELLWTASTEGEPLKMLNAGFTVDGQRLVTYIIGDFLVGNPAPAELRVFDARTGELDRVISAPDCTGNKYFPGVEPPFYDLTKPLVWVRDLDCDFFGTPESELGLLDPATGTFTGVLPIRALPLSIIGVPTGDSTRRLLAVDDAEGLDGRVVDVETGDIVFEYTGGMATLSADGELLIAGPSPELPYLELWEITTGESLWRFDAFMTRAWFSTDESLVYAAGFDGAVYVLDAETGFEIFQLVGHTGIPREVVMSADGTRLASFSADTTARVWDIGDELLSEGIAYSTFTAPRDIFPGGAWMAGSIGVFAAGGESTDGSDAWETVVLEMASGSVVQRLAGGSAAVSPDGSVLAYRPVIELSPGETDSLGLEGGEDVYRVGEVHVVDALSGDLRAVLDARCNALRVGAETVPTEGCIGREGSPEWARFWELAFSPDGSLLAMTDGLDHELTVWSVVTGEVVLQESVEGMHATQPRFAPDQNILLVAYKADGANEFVRVRDLTTLTVVADINPPGSLTDLAFSPANSVVAAGDFQGGLILFDSNDWSVIDRINAHSGTISDVEFSPDGALIASAAEDGVRLWFSENLSLVSDLGFAGDSIEFLAFLDGSHLLLVPRYVPEAIVVSFDTGDLIGIATTKVTRAFTESECATYDIDPCPTLEELREG